MSYSSIIPISEAKIQLITHPHFDRTGSLGELKRTSGAIVYMHSLDAASYSEGGIMRPIEPSPGWISKLIVNRINRNQQSTSEGNVIIDQLLIGNDDLDLTGGIQPIHTPGHTAGHIAYYWPKQGGVLFAGDAASNLVHLGYSILYENIAQGQETLANLSKLYFQMACFSHGKVIRSGAKEKFMKRFAI